jgi:hypothetical protein
LLDGERPVLTQPLCDELESPDRAEQLAASVDGERTDTSDLLGVCW